MFGLGFGELLVIFVLALLFIGPKKIPELARSLGKGIREFQKAKDDLMDEINRPESNEKVGMEHTGDNTKVIDQTAKVESSETASDDESRHENS